jgi:hypothetical protein
VDEEHERLRPPTPLTITIGYVALAILLLGAGIVIILTAFLILSP